MLYFGTAIDNVGKRATAEVKPINIDKTKPAVTFTGIGYYDTTSRRLLIGAMRDDRSNGRLFAGTKL